MNFYVYKEFSPTIMILIELSNPRCFAANRVEDRKYTISLLSVSKELLILFNELSG